MENNNVAPYMGAWIEIAGEWKCLIIIRNKGEGKSALFSMLQNKPILENYKKHLQNKYILGKNEIKENIESIFIEGFSAPEENKKFPTTRQFESLYSKCNEKLNMYEYVEILYQELESENLPASETNLKKAFGDIARQKEVALKTRYGRVLMPQEVIKMLEEICVLNEYKQKANMDVMYMIPDLYLFGLKLSRKGV